jgi:SAM-dependent methyltransferase
MKDSELVSFYESAYSQEPSRGLLYARWRALGAIGKANHVIALCELAGVDPASTLEVGCGDGALLCELHRRGFGGTLHGLEITTAAVEIAQGHPQIDSVERYDGRHLEVGDGHYELGILCHVLEHVPEPSALLREVARACRAVVVEVPLEHNLSARRPAKRSHAQQIGHLQRFDRRQVYDLVRDAGLRVARELDDPLPLEVHRFFAQTRSQRASASAKWAVRSGIHRLTPTGARRLFSVHYACLCLPDG